jgi:hypothetical protein
LLERCHLNAPLFPPQSIVQHGGSVNGEKKVRESKKHLLDVSRVALDLRQSRSRQIGCATVLSANWTLAEMKKHAEQSCQRVAVCDWLQATRRRIQSDNSVPTVNRPTERSRCPRASSDHAIDDGKTGDGKFREIKTQSAESRY